jgi:hypothetical protein
MKRPEEMTDAELDAYLSGGSATKRPEDMTDAELDSFLSGKQPTPKDATEVPKVLNEAADIPWQQRAAVKNFGGSIKDQIDYLQQKNENLEVSEIDGDIVARKSGEKNWKKLDPTGITSFGEAVQDFTDVGYDLADAVASTVATTASGIAGAAASPFALGVGAIPAATLGGGAASAGLEGVRQAIGMGLGTAKKADAGQIALSGVLGALPVPVLGTGASSKQLTKAVQDPTVVRRVLEAAKQEAIPEGAKITGAQKRMAKDIIGQSQEGVVSKLPKAALGAVSGVPSETLRTATDKADPSIVKDLFKEGGVKLNPNKTYTNMELSDWLETGGIDALGRVAQKEVDKVQQALRKTGTKIGQYLDEAGERGVTVNLSNAASSFDNLFSQLDTAARESDSLALREAADKVKSLRDKYFSANVDEVSPRTAFNLKTELADLVDFNRTPLQPGTQLEGAIKDAERILRDEIYDKIDGEALRKAYAEHSDIQEGIYKFFKNKDVAVNSLKNPETLRSPTFKNQIKDFDSKYKTNLTGLSDVAVTWKYFGRPPVQPVVGGGSGQFFRGAGALGGLGTLAGAATGGQIGALVGGAAGGLTGGFLTSPYAIKRGLAGETAVSRAGEAVAGLPGIRQTLAGREQLQRQLPVNLQSLASGQGITQLLQETEAVPGLWDLLWQQQGGR